MAKLVRKDSGEVVKEFPTARGAKIAWARVYKKDASMEVVETAVE